GGERTSDAREAPGRRGGDVRPRRGPVRPAQRRAVARSGPRVAAPGRRRRRAAPRAEGARPGGRHRHLQRAVRPRRRHRRAHRPLDGHAGGRQATASRPRLRRGRRPRAALRRRRLRRGHHLLRAAQRRGHPRSPARAAPCHPARGHARRLRVLHPHLAAVPHGLRRLPGGRAAADRHRPLPRPGRLPLPGRVDPGLAGPGRPGRPAAGSRLAAGGVARPERRRGRPAPGPGV
ncbi:MAG: Demethylmenaquinone methyltransferase, partial [uncultured Friedmanniella sp.]